jgi:heme/copper-type cytochrome/quinol oxidase subunit 2
MATYTSDQERFDREVQKKGKLFLQILGGLAIFVALILSIIAISSPSENRVEVIRNGTPTQSQQTASSTGGQQTTPTPASGSQVAGGGTPQTVELKVIPEGKRGPEGKLHDAFTVTEFRVTVGKPLYLKIDNTDTVPHSITAPEAGVNIIVEPGVHTYTLEVNKAGRFEWHCIFPCDPWSMEHIGYMRGYIVATA